MRIYPTLRCSDARAMIAFLEAAFGLETKARHEGEGGTIAHAELAWGDHVVMLGEGSAEFPVQPTALYLSCADPDALFERATAAGAEVLYAPRDTDYGSREFGVRDPDGGSWSFGTYEPYA